MNSINFKTKLIATLAFWLLFLSVDVFKKSMLGVADSNYIIFYYLAGFILWFLLTFPFYQFFNYSSRWHPAIRFAVLILLAPVIGVFKVTLNWLCFYLSLLIPGYLDTSFINFLFKQSSFHHIEASIIAWVLLLLFFLTELYTKYQSKNIEAAELRSQLVESQLSTLRMQLQPHFLFNAHNTVSMLIRTKQYDQAIEMTSKLGDLLRITLHEKNEQFVTLKEELEFINRYVELEQIRFQDRLTVSVSASNDTLNALVPNLILQPIVENAFKHGFAKYLGDVSLSVDTYLDDGKLVLEITNTGPPLESNFELENNSGLGLTNVRNRLQQLYADNYSISFSYEPDQLKCQLIMSLKYA